MMRGLFTAASGMSGNQFLVDNISNNLANVNTTGYKKSRVDFRDLLYQTIRPAGSSASSGVEVPSGIQVGHGTRVAATRRLFSQGNLKQTENPLDIAILGSGFFKIQMPDGTEGFTRDGSFSKDSAGNMVNADGLLLADNITIPEDTISLYIGSDGTVSASQAGQTQQQELGSIMLNIFQNPAGLEARGDNLFVPTSASGTATEVTPGEQGAGTLAHGFLETSNVSVVEEMVGLIIAQRAYEVNSRAVQTSDEMLQTANNIRR
jgi:flagellar basal-body rod protein FlgG